MGDYFNLSSYVLSRFAFISTCLVSVYWLNYLFNDPFNLGLPTLDVSQKSHKDILPPEKCTPFIQENAIWNFQLFSLWIITHSGLARRKYKEIVGLLDHPLERPLFAAIAPVVWFINIQYWKPISNCERWDPLQTSFPFAIVSGVIGTLSLLLILTFACIMPDHIFGTAKYQYPPGYIPPSSISYGYPYGLVRHPAATGFLWIYALLPAHTPSHYLLASFWIVSDLLYLFYFFPFAF